MSSRLPSRDATVTFAERIEKRGARPRTRRKHDGDNRHAVEKQIRAKEVNAALIAEAAAHGGLEKIEDSLPIRTGTVNGVLDGNGTHNSRKSRRLIVASNEEFTAYVYSGDHAPMHVHVEMNIDSSEKARFIIVREDDRTFSCEPYPYKFKNVDSYAAQEHPNFTMEGPPLARAKAFVRQNIQACISIWNSVNTASTPIRREEVGEVLSDTLLFPAHAHREDVIRERNGVDWLALAQKPSAAGYKK